MDEIAPRLLVTLPDDPNLTTAIDRGLPGIPWGYASRVPESNRGSVEALLVGSFTRDVGRFDALTLPQLRFVQRSFTGIDGFPFDRVAPSVKVAGNVGAFGPFVSEHAVAIALAAGRQLPHALEMVREGKLRPVSDPRVLHGATCVVLGYGEIGNAIGTRVAAFGATVVGLSRSGRPAPGVARMYPADRLREALAEGDFVFEVRPLTAQTRGSIGAAELAAMRPTAVFVNVGRAATVDEAALYQHLTTHPEFRAALDVWWKEDYVQGVFSTNFPFATLPNFVGTPHCAGYAPGAEERSVRMAIENLARYFRDGRPDHIVDRSEYAPA